MERYVWFRLAQNAWQWKIVNIKYELRKKALLT
jgi:hypothetical protein